MDKKKIAKHIVDIAQDRTPEYQEEFNEWIQKNPSAIDVLHELSDEDNLNESYKNYYTPNKNYSANKLLKRISKQKEKHNRQLRGLVAAAVIALSFIVGNYTNLFEFNTKDTHKIAEENQNNNIKLILENGDVIELNKSMDTVKSQNITLQKTGDNKIVFKDETDNEKINTMRLVVPQKNNYSIELADGTTVTLNANSELIFPNKFNGERREVTIIGEGYFDVAKDSLKPFIVHTSNIDIQVYGTKFNVNNYNPSFIETFLVEGSIGITIDNKVKKMISPNQIATVSGEGIEIKEVTNSDKYLAWKNNYFIFDSDNLSKVIDDLSRWYNVEIHVTKSSNLNLPITGSFKRGTPLNTIIESLEMISNINLKVENK